MSKFVVVRNEDNRIEPAYLVISEQRYQWTLDISQASLFDELHQAQQIEQSMQLKPNDCGFSYGVESRTKALEDRLAARRASSL